MTPIRWMAVAMLGSLAVAPAARSEYIIGAPGAAGGGGLSPFGSHSTVTEEYQQVYDYRAFSGPITFGEIEFFNKNFQPGQAVIDTATYTIRFSTTSKPVGGLDTNNLANNVGSNDQAFFSGTLGGPIGASETLSIVGTPYAYDPGGRLNLLIDIVKTNYQPHVGDNSALDIVFNGPTSLADKDVNPSAGNSYGLVTGFGAVPEPSSLALCGLGLAVVAGYARRRRPIVRA